MDLTVRELIDKVNELIDRGTLSSEAVIKIWDSDLLTHKGINIDLERTFYNLLELDTTDAR